ncbi:zinc-ribbon domain-containing protein [Paenibacillus sp. WLX1005]|uniref:zinc-ribbon domain-containing protein n=1 Tax=Paenibacillus sp. WLX1005 TaxID=3243766 RepID=UPI00398444B9
MDFIGINFDRLRIENFNVDNLEDLFGFLIVSMIFIMFSAAAIFMITGFIMGVIDRIGKIIRWVSGKGWNRDNRLEYCPSCDQQVSKKVRYCPHCGRDFGKFHRIAGSLFYCFYIGTVFSFLSFKFLQILVEYFFT